MNPDEHNCTELDRFVNLEKRVVIIEQNIEHSKDMNRILIDEMTRLLTRHDHMLVGTNGEAGIMADVKALKDANLIGTVRSLQITIAKWGGAITIVAFIAPIIAKYLFH